MPPDVKDVTHQTKTTQKPKLNALFAVNLFRRKLWKDTRRAAWKCMSNVDFI